MTALRSAIAWAAAATASLSLCGPGAAETAQDPPLSPLQVIADMTLIDARCHNSLVNFGALFRYGEDHGIGADTILPLGARRRAFEAALASRLAAASPEDLCGAIAAEDDAAAPGIIHHP